MEHETVIRDLLAPLGVYKTDGGFVAAEMRAVARVLDDLLARALEAEAESMPDTARDWGLRRREALFFRTGHAGAIEARRQALRALLNISGDGLTLDALSQALHGSGTWARVEENGIGAVTVSFPGVPGIPEQFETLKEVIEEILPCHLDIVYAYWYITWTLFEEAFSTWDALEASGLSWREVETLVGSTV